MPGALAPGSYTIDVTFEDEIRLRQALVIEVLPDSSLTIHCLKALENCAQR
jgi:hypothetical protein